MSRAVNKYLVCS